MKKRNMIIVLCAFLSVLLSGCADKEAQWPEDTNGTSPRLIIRGIVNNEEGKAISGVYVSAVSVREANEPDIPSYNYAVTDTTGHYTIVRYRGRELPTEVTLVATDSSGVYEEAYLFAPVRYDSVRTYRGIIPHDGYVEADFVLKRL